MEKLLKSGLVRRRCARESREKQKESLLQGTISLFDHAGGQSLDLLVSPIDGTVPGARRRRQQSFSVEKAGGRAVSAVGGAVCDRWHTRIVHARSNKEKAPNQACIPAVYPTRAGRGLENQGERGGFFLFFFTSIVDTVVHLYMHAREEV